MKGYTKIFVLFIFVLITLVGCQASTEKKPVPDENNTAGKAKYSTLMAEASADPYKNGCVSCHKKQGDVDRSLPAYVKKIEGHPEVKESTVNACYYCHEAQKNPELFKRFVRGMHKTHWKSEAFYGNLNARCYSCHTVELNGVSGLKEYPLAGYRTPAASSNNASANGQTKTETRTPKTNNNQGGTDQDKGKQEQDQQNPNTKQNQQQSQQNQQQNENEGLAVPQNGNADIELPVPTP